MAPLWVPPRGPRWCALSSLRHDTRSSSMALVGCPQLGRLRKLLPRASRGGCKGAFLMHPPLAVRTRSASIHVSLLHGTWGPITPICGVRFQCVDPLPAIILITCPERQRGWGATDHEAEGPVVLNLHPLDPRDVTQGEHDRRFLIYGLGVIERAICERAGVVAASGQQALGKGHSGSRRRPHGCDLIGRWPHTGFID